MNVPSVLGDVEARCKRFDEAVERRQPWETMWRRAFNYAIPNKEVFTNRSKGDQRNAQVFDETAVRAVPKFATRVQAALVPTWSQFAKLVPGTAVPDDTEINLGEFEGVIEGADVGEILESYTERVFDFIHLSNFSSQAYEAFQDMSISTAALFCEPDDEKHIKFTAVPLHTFYRDTVCDRTMWREHDIEGGRIKRKWPDAELPEEVSQAIESKPSQKYKIVEGTIFDAERGEYHLVLMIKSKKVDIYHESMGPSSPWIVFGWDMTPGEIYHRGPVIEVLPAILSLNKIWEYALQNGAFKAAGAWTAAEGDGVWNPHNVRIQPGSVIAVNSNESSNPSIRQLDVGGDLQYVDWMISQKTRVVEEALFANPMGTVEDTPVRTLGENMLRVQDMLEQAGASFSLLETDFVAKVMDRVIYLLVEAGKLPALKEGGQVDGESINLKMQSPLAQARDAEGLESLTQFYNAIAPFGPEVMQVMVDAEQVFKYAQEGTGLPKDFINDKDGQAQAIENIQALMGQPSGESGPV